MSISAKDVKQLRDMTGAGMMDCKKALTETGGDIEGAIEFLRKKGQKLAVKRVDREAKEGVVVALVSDDRKRGVVVRLSCETDFVAKNDDFVKFAKSIADHALAEFKPTKEELLATDFGGITLGDKIVEQLGVIGEKLELASYETIEAEMCVPYIHSGYRAGVVIGLNKADDSFVAPGKDVAMQVAAMMPVAVDADGVSEEIKQKELEIGMELARNEGKPEAMLEKISLGRLNKFYKESTLLNQAFVKDNKMNVGAYLKTFDKDLTVTEFKHVKLG